MSKEYKEEVVENAQYGKILSGYDMGELLTAFKPLEPTETAGLQRDSGKPGRDPQYTTLSLPTTETAGVKFDQDKPSMSSIPKEAMWEMGKALAYGAKKYGDGNFRNGMLVSRQLSAAVRHIYQHLDGENIDQESGNTHIGHALASLAMAAYTLANHPNLDDRHPIDKAKNEKPK